MKKWMILLLAGLLCVSPLTACGQNDTDGTKETEEETTYRDLPRFDYMNDTVGARVTISREAYMNMNLKLPADLEITNETVDDYIFGQRLEKRVPTYRAETETETETTDVTTGTVTDTETDGSFEMEDDAFPVAVAAETGTETATETTTETETEDPSHVKDQPLRLGDDAYIYYKGVYESTGEAFDGGSNMDDKNPTKLTLGSGQFIPGFEEGLVGVIPNTTSRDEPYALHISFPENYGSKDLAGKAVIFYVVVEYAVQYEIPAFDKEFVLTTMKYEPKKDEAEYEDEIQLLEEYRAYVYETIEKNWAADVDEAKGSALWEYLLSVSVCQNLPEEEIEYYFGSYLENIKSNYDYYCGVYGEYYTAMYPTVDVFAITSMGLDKDADWKAELRKQAEEPVKRDMIMYAVAEQEGIKTVTDEEFNDEIQYYIDYYKSYNITKTRQDILDEVGEEYIRLVAFQVKMDEWLKEKCVFTYGE